MTAYKQENIMKNADLLYRAFPVEYKTINHNAIIKACEVIQRVKQYRGADLPKYYLERVHSENKQALQALELDPKGACYTVARKAIREAEAFSSWVLLKQDVSNS